MVKIIGSIKVCDDCMLARETGEPRIDRPAEAPEPWSKLPTAQVAPNCRDCDLGDSHDFLWRADCDACGDEVNTLHTYAVFAWEYVPPVRS